MALVSASNLTAAGIDYQYATADSDQFDRLHIAQPAKALDLHDHTDTKGLPAGRVAVGAVGTPGLADGAVTDLKIANATIVGSAKLVDASVTSGKIATTLASKTLTDPVLSGSVDIQGIALLDTGVTVASATAITLGADGNTFPISGTAVITTITAKPTGTEVTLRTTSTAQVRAGGNVFPSGAFIGSPNAQLTLISDGTNWYEKSRANSIYPLFRFALAVDTPDIPTGNTTSLSWDTEDSDYPDALGIHAAAAADFVPTVAGMWRLSGTIQWATTSASALEAWLEKNTVRHRDLQAVPGLTAIETTNALDSIVRANGTTDIFRVRVKQNSGSNQRLRGAADLSKTNMQWEWLGP